MAFASKKISNFFKISKDSSIFSSKIKSTLLVLNCFIFSMSNSEDNAISIFIKEFGSMFSCDSNKSLLLVMLE